MIVEVLRLVHTEWRPRQRIRCKCLGCTVSNEYVHGNGDGNGVVMEWVVDPFGDGNGIIVKWVVWNRMRLLTLWQQEHTYNMYLTMFLSIAIASSHHVNTCNGSVAAAVTQCERTFKCGLVYVYLSGRTKNG